MLRQTIMIITNVLVSVSLSQTKNWTYFCPPLFARQKYFWSILTNTRYVSGQVTLMWTQTLETLSIISNVCDNLWAAMMMCEEWARHFHIGVTSHQSPNAPDCHCDPRRKLAPGDMRGVMDGHRARRVAWVITTWRRKAEGWVLEKQCWEQRAECLWHAGKNCVNLLQTGKAFNYTRAVQIEFCFRPISPIS